MKNYSTLNFHCTFIWSPKGNLLYTTDLVWSLDSIELEKSLITLIIGVIGYFLWCMFAIEYLNENVLYITLIGVNLWLIWRNRITYNCSWSCFRALFVSALLWLFMFPNQLVWWLVLVVRRVVSNVLCSEIMAGTHFTAWSVERNVTPSKESS